MYTTKGPPDLTNYPQRKVEIDPSGWLFDPKAKAWISVPNAAKGTTLELSGKWIKANQPPATPGPLQKRPPFKGTAFEGAGWYVAAHPTHYAWREDVEQLAWRMERDHYCYANTYYDHPPGWGLDATSVDFWHPDGRGVAIDEPEAEAIITEIFNDPNPPWIAWFIRNGQIWTPGEGYEPFGAWPDDGSDSGHYNHVHITFQ